MEYQNIVPVLKRIEDHTLTFVSGMGIDWIAYAVSAKLY